MNAGAVRGTACAPEVTALGRWLARRLREQAPVQIGSDWSASAVLAHLRAAGEDADLWRLSREWRWEREPEEAADQLLSAAAALVDAGPDEALSYLADAADPTSEDPLDAHELVAALPGSGHPQAAQAAQAAQALTEFLASGAPRLLLADRNHTAGDRQPRLAELGDLRAVRLGW